MQEDNSTQIAIEKAIAGNRSDRKTACPVIPVGKKAS
jgi:hypothetical protein